MNNKLDTEKDLKRSLGTKESAYLSKIDHVRAKSLSPKRSHSSQLTDHALEVTI